MPLPVPKSSAAPRRVLVFALLSSACVGELVIDPSSEQLGWGRPFDELQAEVLWEEIADHSNWQNLDGSAGARPSAMHSGYQVVFANETAMGDTDALGLGSIIVARNYADEGLSELKSVTVMKRLKNFAPNHNNWFWVEFTDRGYVALSEDGFPLAGAVGVEGGGCVGCHQDAPGGDFVFQNGGAPPPPTGPMTPPAELPYGQPQDLELAGTLWATMAGHDAWPGFPGREGIQPIETPHSSYVSFHLNEVAQMNTESPVSGAIIATRNHRNADDPASIESVTVMFKQAGYNPAQGDWFWAKFKPTGELMLDPQGFGMAGAVGQNDSTGCLSCHINAPGDDFIFANEGSGP